MMEDENVSSYFPIHVKQECFSFPILLYLQYVALESVRGLYDKSYAKSLVWIEFLSQR